MTDWIPEPLLELGPGGLAWWQWIAVATAIPLAIIVGRIVGGGLRIVVGRFTRRTETTLDDELTAAFMRPLRLFCTIAALRLCLPFVELPLHPAAIAHDILRALLAWGVVWSVLRTIDVSANRIGRAHWAIARPSSRAIILLFARVAKVVVVVIAVIGVLGSLGLPVSSVLAGLGIGGIALAFGAQKTVENLFGAVAIGVDQPLREGDFVRIESDVIGTVEAVGLRSSRIRTLDRTIVTLPNGKLADARIETFAPRDRCRFSTTLGLVYETSAAQLRAILAGLEKALRDHPQIWPDDIVVRFAGFGASSLDVEIVAYFATGDWGQYRGYRQEVLLAFMDVVETNGSSFAFPTQTVHVVQDAPLRT